MMQRRKSNAPREPDWLPLVSITLREYRQRRRDGHENATDNNVLDESAGGDAHGRRMIDNK